MSQKWKTWSFQYYPSSLHCISTQVNSSFFPFLQRWALLNDSQNFRAYENLQEFVSCISQKLNNNFIITFHFPYDPPKLSHLFVQTTVHTDLQILINSKRFDNGSLYTWWKMNTVYLMFTLQQFYSTISSISYIQPQQTIWLTCSDSQEIQTHCNQKRTTFNNYSFKHLKKSEWIVVLVTNIFVKNFNCWISQKN